MTASLRPLPQLLLILVLLVLTAACGGVPDDLDRTVPSGPVLTGLDGTVTPAPPVAPVTLEQAAQLMPTEIQDALAANLTYFDFGENGFCIVDTATSVGKCAGGVTLDRSILYIPLSVANSGLSILDISAPQAPRTLSELSSSELGSYGWATAVVSPTVYVTYEEALVVVDASAVQTPRRAAYTEMTGGSTRDIAVQGNTLLLFGTAFQGSESEAVLRLFDVSRPNVPLQMSRLPLPMEWGGALTVVEDFVYVVGAGQLAVIDFSEPTAPFVTAWMVLEGETDDVIVENGYAFVAAGQAGIWVIAVTDPTAPVVAGYLDVSTDVRRLLLLDDRLYLSAYPLGSGEMAIVDVKWP